MSFLLFSASECKYSVATLFLLHTVLYSRYLTLRRELCAHHSLNLHVCLSYSKKLYIAITLVQSKHCDFCHLFITKLEHPSAPPTRTSCIRERNLGNFVWGWGMGGMAYVDKYRVSTSNVWDGNGLITTATTIHHSPSTVAVVTAFLPHSDSQLYQSSRHISRCDSQL